MSWSRSFDRCTNCGKASSPHKCRGLCSKCYDNARYEKNKPAVQWSRLYTRCRRCWTTDGRHEGYGLCTACGKSFYRAKKLAPDLTIEAFLAPPPEASLPMKTRLPRTLSNGCHATVAQWGLEGTIVGSPYFFMGQRVADMRNQWGEVIQHIPLHFFQVLAQC